MLGEWKLDTGGQGRIKKEVGHTVWVWTVVFWMHGYLG